jgi:hypothetical protein
MLPYKTRQLRASIASGRNRDAASANFCQSQRISQDEHQRFDEGDAVIISVLYLPVSALRGALRIGFKFLSLLGACLMDPP